MKTIGLLSVLMATNIVWAGKLEVIGEGVASRPAEFIRMNMQIHADCSTTAAEAKANVDRMSREVQVALQDFVVESIGDQLQVAPSGQSQLIKKEYIGNEQVVICDKNHSWTSSENIAFKLVDLKQLAELQDKVFKAGEKNAIVGGINQARLQLTMAKPEPGVFASTWDEMNDVALKQAYQHAMRQVKIIVDLENPGGEINLVKMTATKDASGSLVYDQVTATGDTAGDSLGRVVVRMSRLFVFNAK